MLEEDKKLELSIDLYRSLERISMYPNLDRIKKENIRFRMKNVRKQIEEMLEITDEELTNLIKNK